MFLRVRAEVHAATTPLDRCSVGNRRGATTGIISSPGFYRTRTFSCGGTLFLRYTHKGRLTSENWNRFFFSAASQEGYIVINCSTYLSYSHLLAGTRIFDIYMLCILYACIRILYMHVRTFKCIYA